MFASAKLTFRRFLLAGLCAVMVLAGCYVFRAPLLTGLAKAWIVDNPISRADAIVVLGGGLEYRPFAAARLFTNGAAPVILIAQEELNPTQQLGLSARNAVTARKVLVQLGVPESAIQPLGTNVTSTRDEAMALRDWALEHKAHSVLIPTDIFHTRRARWMFRKALTGTEVQVHITSVNPPRFTATNWWHVEDGLITFQNEIIKNVYYRLKY